MFKMIKGAKIDDGINLKEEYKVFDKWISANISAENIRKVVNKFIEIEEGNQFCLFIELPSNQEDENVIGVTQEGYCQVDCLHMDVYYLDDISADQLMGLLDIFEDILVNDGLSSFGVLSQSGREIGKYKYNVIKAYSHDGLSPIVKVFTALDIPETDELITAWNYFSKDNPGISEIYNKDGKTIYDVVDTLKEIGMYKAEQREE